LGYFLSSDILPFCKKTQITYL